MLLAKNYNDSFEFVKDSVHNTVGPFFTDIIYILKYITIGIGSNDEFLNNAELLGALCKDFL